MKENKGITLVALVVTIVVLIILATVSINAIFSENGIIQKAQESKDMAANSTVKEEEELNMVMSEYNNEMAEPPIEPEPPLEIISITLNKTEVTIKVGESTSLEATIEPADASNKNLAWTSSNDTVATVTNGTVIGVTAGSAIITAKATDGSNKTATCNVTVTEPPPTAETAGLQVGDYVNYSVSYTNVGTFVNNSTGEIIGYIPLDEYTGWRVLSIEGSGSNTYVKLISAGVPLNYYHGTDPATSVTNLTTNFFNTPINSTVTEENFYSCGFKNSANNPITTIAGLKTLFTNEFTQMTGDVPKVQAMTKDELDKAFGSTTGNGTSVKGSDLLAVPCEASQSSDYASIWLASASIGINLWSVNSSGDVRDGANYDRVSRCPPGSFSDI